jgi:hypothetical protein
MVTGMLGGVVVLLWIWSTGATAWTWYAFVGAGVTSGTALIASLLLPTALTADAV